MLNKHVFYVKLSLSLFFVQLNWLSVDFNNWKDWEDDSDEELSSFDRFSEVCVCICTTRYASEYVLWVV